MAGSGKSLSTILFKNFLVSRNSHVAKINLNAVCGNPEMTLNECLAMVGELGCDGGPIPKNWFEEQKNLAIICDGLDQLPEKLPERATPVQRGGKSTPANWLHNILERKVLSNSLVLLTSRPKSLLDLKTESRPSADNLYSLSGFNESSMKMACKVYEVEWKDMESVVKSKGDNFFKLSRVPLLFSMMCILVKQKGPKNVISTSVWTLFKEIFTQYHTSKHTNEIVGDVKEKLLRFYYDSYNNGVLTFTGKDFLDAGISLEQLEDLTMVKFSAKIRAKVSPDQLSITPVHQALQVSLIKN